MNHKTTKPRQGRHHRKIPLLTELAMFLDAGFYKYVAPTALGIRQSVTNCHQLKFVRHCVRQSVTKCYRLKTGGVFITQPVTNCYRLKTSPNPRNLIPSP